MSVLGRSGGNDDTMSGTQLLLYSTRAHGLSAACLDVACPDQPFDESHWTIRCVSLFLCPMSCAFERLAGLHVQGLQLQCNVTMEKFEQSLPAPKVRIRLTRT